MMVGSWRRAREKASIARAALPAVVGICLTEERKRKGDKVSSVNNSSDIAMGISKIHPSYNYARNGSICNTNKCLLVDGCGHEHLHAASAADHARLLDRLRQHAQSVVQRALSLLCEKRWCGIKGS